MILSDRVKIPIHVMTREVGGEAVILNVASGTYFGLDEVGARMWQHMSDGKTLTDICDLMVEEFDVSRKELERDTLKLAQDLATEGLITLADA